MITDEQLLQAYARERNESAFGELVTRHLDFVYSAALRVVNGDAPLAQDVTQTVFIELARQGRSLPPDVALTAWLHRHTSYTAAKAVRSERRRQTREHTAMEMRALDDNTQPDWAQVAPYLDESLNELNPADRDALVLRFLRQQDLRTVGETLGISEDAARKRVDRALEKLHVLLKQRGATLTVAALGTALATQAVTAAPAGLAGSIAAAALAIAAAGGSIAFTISQTMKMLVVKAAVATVLGAALLAAAVHHYRANKSLRAGDVALREIANGPGEIENLTTANARSLLSGDHNVGIKLSGMFDHAVYDGDVKPKFSGRYKFEATIAGASWIITYESIKFEENDAFYRKAGHAKEQGTASCDGTNIYLVAMQSEVNAKRAWGDKYESVKNELPVALATIYPGNYPPPVNTFLQAIWLASSSATVLRDPAGRAKPPFYYDLATFYNTNCYCDYYWTANEAHPETRQLTFKVDGHIFEKDLSNGQMIDARHVPPYDNGYTIAEGAWSGGTNIGGVFVWRRFEFTAFNPKPGGRRSTDLQTSFIEQCVVTNISIVAVPQIPPQLPAGKVCVTDLTDGDFEKLEERLGYITTDGWR
ncbi:MAG: sigma-70 family RNA polymerase sigma factor [Verrucomicrobia bacterium]|nr:sigma-70 family RNA polymerase sigma factor [Verrucomicrobiota bacterium]